MNITNGKILKAVQPLYGLPEVGLHWFITYRDNYQNNLGMQSSTVDNCLLFRKRPDRKVPEVVILQVDDTFGSGSDTFLKDEEAQSHQFQKWIISYAASTESVEAA